MKPPRAGHRIGIDLDNTIVCYDQVFQRLASEHSLIPANLPASKETIRRHALHAGREDAWTLIQGEAYGRSMSEARLFPGVLDFLYAGAAGGADIFIVSHRTLVPIAGPTYDLHLAARQWLGRSGVLDQLGSNGDRVFLETTEDAKLRRIAELDLDYFIDDRSDLLRNPDFPQRTLGVHFDPDLQTPSDQGLAHAASWHAVQRLILGPA